MDYLRLFVFGLFVDYSKHGILEIICLWRFWIWRGARQSKRDGMPCNGVPCPVMVTGCLPTKTRQGGALIMSRTRRWLCVPLQARRRVPTSLLPRKMLIVQLDLIPCAYQASNVGAKVDGKRWKEMLLKFHARLAIDLHIVQAEQRQ